MKPISFKKIALLSLLCLSAGARAQDVYQAQRAAWLSKAEAEKPALIETRCRPQCIVRPVADPAAFQGWRMEKSGEMEELYGRSFKEVKSVTVDFGRHMTGYFTFFLKTIYRVQDAPVRIRFTFGEVPAELCTPLDPFPGTLSRAWMQDEVVTVMHIDRPATIDRRLSGRYMKIDLLGASPDFDFALSDLFFTALSSVAEPVTTLPDDVSPEIRAINDVAISTLRECMQTVYEDGPKRDMRLWIGDLYLESLANACSFQRYGLTKRCLYLLAGLAAPDGNLYANVFEKPEPHPQVGSYCLSYNLLFNATLLEYLKTTGDRDTALDLWCVARNQLEDALSYVDDRGIFDRNRKNGFVWLFFDWRAGLEESTAMQGLVIRSLEQGYELAKLLGREVEAVRWPRLAEKMRTAARKHLYDRKQGLFVSGPDRQVSWMSQIWMILSDVVPPAQGRQLLERLETVPGALTPGSPYGNHYLVEAMIRCGMHDRAREFLLAYWGGMVRKGADTFWEVWDPADERLSPYNFFPLNSYCHAWSCTPVYFIHRYPEVFQR